MTRSLWHDEAPAPAPPLAEDARVDLLIVGGGMTGLFAAYEAGSLGLRAMLVEADHLFAGATGRNAGFLLAAPEAHYSDSIRAHGRKLAREIWRFNRDNLHEARRLLERLGASDAMEPTGSAIAAVDREEAKALEEDARLLREDGFPGTLVDGPAAARATGSDGFRGALLVEDDGQVHPVRALSALAREAARLGIQLHEGTRVTRLRRAGDAWEATTASGRTVTAKAVICGLNAYTPELLDLARERVRPVRGQVLATAPLPARAIPRPVYADRGYLYVRSAGTRIVAGGMRHTSFDEEVGTMDAVTERLQRAIEDALATYWPQARGAVITHRWSGVMGFSRDGLPWIGEVPGSPGLWAAFACTGHGWGYWPWAGRALARHAVGEKAHEIPAWARIDRPLR